MKLSPLAAFVGVAALSAVAFAPMVEMPTPIADGKAQAVAAGQQLGRADDATLAALDGLAADEYLGVACEDGSAGPFPCDNVTMEALVPMTAFGGGQGTDTWGWTAPDGTEYAIMGSGLGTGIFALTDGTPTYMGLIPSNGAGYGTVWRDMKIVNDHLYITSEVGDATTVSHGIQVVDMMALHEGGPRGVIVPDNTIAGGFDGHNLVEFDDRGILGIVASTGIVDAGLSPNPSPCGGGLVFLDIDADPLNPPVAGCYGGGQDAEAAQAAGFGAPGQSHDAQCVVYSGPDADYNGAGADGELGTADDVAPSDICLLFNEGRGVFIIDASAITRDRGGPDARATTLAQVQHAENSYNHQGWFTDNHRWVLFNDEGDETAGNVSNTTTYWFDASDLDMGQTGTTCPLPLVSENCPVKRWANPNTASIDHNMYPVGNRLYQANYGAGLRVLEFSDESLAGPQEAAFEEVAFFDVHPGTDLSEFYGTWNVYPFFESRTLVVSDFDKGLFLLKVEDEVTDEG